MTIQTCRTVATVLFIAAMAAVLSSILFTSIWEIYARFMFDLLCSVTEKLHDSIGDKLTTYVIISVVLAPFIALIVLIGAAFRPFIRRPALEVYENQSRRIAGAQKALREAAFYLEGLTKDVAGKSTELETLSHKLETGALGGSDTPQGTFL